MHQEARGEADIAQGSGEDVRKLERSEAAPPLDMCSLHRTSGRPGRLPQRRTEHPRLHLLSETRNQVLVAVWRPREPHPVPTLNFVT